MKRLRPIALLLVIVTAVPTLVRGQTVEKGTISGRVTDKKTAHAIPFATITVMGAQRGALSDAQGAYTVTGVPVGTYEVRVQFRHAPQSCPGVGSWPESPPRSISRWRRSWCRRSRRSR